ncbi:hypothetical protein LV779_36500 [Streptomyces thinghirensis]|nr:hypothetical protein [Streptomyces thinghirensis]
MTPLRADRRRRAQVGGLYEVDLTADGATAYVATHLGGGGVRVALDGAGHAYVCDSAGGKVLVSSWPTARPRAVGAWWPTT